jgi:hypothetical protein
VFVPNRLDLLALRNSTKRLGRAAGAIYLLMIVSAAFGYTTMTRVLAGNAADLSEGLLNGSTFQLAFWSMIAGLLAWVVLAYLLYQLMGSYGRFAAGLMFIFTIAGAAVNLVAMSHLFPLLGSASAIDAATVALMTHSYDRLLVLAQIFSGLWMFPFGWLVIRSRIAPRFIGFCLMAGGVGYLFIPITKAAPHLDQYLAYWIVSRAPGVPAMLGEIGMCLWLLVKGGSPPVQHASPRAA